VPIVGVIGALQLDVIAARMSTEYNIPCVVDRLPHIAARWPIVPAGESLTVPTMGVLDAVDRHGRQVLVFESEWALRYTAEKNPRVDFRNTT